MKRLDQLARWTARGRNRGSFLALTRDAQCVYAGFFGRD
jgi:hypothetical protein